MRRILTMFFLAAASVVPAFTDYPREGWTDSIVEAVARAEREDKMLLLDFTGSDWCLWCFKLDEEVWETREFQRWSENNLVKVFLDFPQSIRQTEETTRQNRILQRYFRVRGYPTVFILDSDLTPLLRTGYREGGPESYIRHIQEDRNLKLGSAEKFRANLKSVIQEHIGPIGRPGISPR